MFSFKKKTIIVSLKALVWQNVSTLLSMIVCACSDNDQRVRQKISPTRSDDSSSYTSEMKFFFFYHDTQHYVHSVEVKDVVSPVCNPNPHRIDQGFVQRMALESVWFFFERVTDLEVCSRKAVQNIVFYVVRRP